MRECDGDAAVAGAGEASTERALDSMTLERERGITIAAKYTSMPWRGHTLNAVDTPGHADFGGEVERVLGMVDGAVLLVDASEGPLAQTKFVVAKALARGLRPILLLNKVDRSAVTEARCAEVQNAVFDLFAALNASDEQLDFPTLYASARQGWVAASWDDATAALSGAPHKGMAPLLDAVLEYIPPPTGTEDAPFSSAWFVGSPHVHVPPHLRPPRPRSGCDHDGARPVSWPHPDGPRGERVLPCG